MSFSVQKSRFFNTIPKSVLVVLIATFSVGLFIVGFDQGHIFSLIYGESAFIDQFLHELTHDM